MSNLVASLLDAARQNPAKIAVDDTTRQMTYKQLTAFAAAMRRAAGLPARRTLIEPARRNTAMAVGVAAYRLLAHDPEAVMVVLPGPPVGH